MAKYVSAAHCDGRQRVIVASLESGQSLWSGWLVAGTSPSRSMADEQGTQRFDASSPRLKGRTLTVIYIPGWVQVNFSEGPSSCTDRRTWLMLDRQKRLTSGTHSIKSSSNFINSSIRFCSSFFENWMSNVRTLNFERKGSLVEKSLPTNARWWAPEESAR